MTACELAQQVQIIVVDRDGDLEPLALRAAAAGSIAIDVEANGLYAYRPNLCTVQVAWCEADLVMVAIVDALKVSVRPLGPLVGSTGPIKVLHDLSFDARLLSEAGIPLSRVRDTSVAARFLGYSQTGLAALLDAELGVTIDKHLQQHNWAQRPLSDVAFQYLAQDVLYLLALDAKLQDKTRAIEIEEEVEDECVYKLDAALTIKPVRPYYCRIKGAKRLDPTGRAILRRLSDLRERAAERDDVPPFRIASNQTLIELAKRRPTSLDSLRSVRGAITARTTKVTLAAWQEAIEQGLHDGNVPEQDRRFFEPIPIAPQLIAARRTKASEISAWRKAEAVKRGVDEQVVLPGHCAQDLLGIATGEDATNEALREAIVKIPGIGAKRLSRYGDALFRLAYQAGG